MLGGGKDKLLEGCREDFLGGDGSALMTALMACSLFQLKIPDWVADELLTLDNKLITGEVSDMNSFFKYDPKMNTRRYKARRIELLDPEVCDALFSHRINGGNFSDRDGLDKVTVEINDSRKAANKAGVSRLEVGEVYKKNKGWLKSVPNNNLSSG